MLKETVAIQQIKWYVEESAELIMKEYHVLSHNTILIQQKLSLTSNGVLIKFVFKSLNNSETWNHDFMCSWLQPIKTRTNQLLVARYNFEVNLSMISSKSIGKLQVNTVIANSYFALIFIWIFVAICYGLHFRLNY